MDADAEVRRAYGALAVRYVELFGRTDQVHDDDLDLITRHLAPVAGAVLDVGCGPGHITTHLCSLGAEASGIDLVPELLDLARAAHPTTRYVQGSVRDLPVADGSVAGIVAWYSLIHVPPDDLGAVLAELRRALRPGGTLVTGFFDGDEPGPFDHQVATAHTWPVGELSARLQRAGFTEVERQQRPGVALPGRRPHAALALRAS